MTRALRASNDRLDFALAGLMALVACVVAGLLIADVNLFVRPAADPSAKTQVATLTEAAAGVRRRPHDLPLWDTARLAEPLYLKDFVLTDKDASAKLTFQDDSTIELGENTLVEVQQVEQNSVLNVIKGTLKAQTGQGGAEVLIRLPGSSQIIRSKPGTALEVTVTKGQPARVKVLAGRMEVGDRRLRVTAHQAATIPEGIAEPRIEALTLMLSTPAHGARLRDPPASGTQLTWQGTGEAFRVEIATDQSFSRIVKDFPTTAPEASTGSLPDGVYYWRVTQGAEVSETRKFTIASTRGPVLYFPGDGQATSDLSPLLSWETLPGTPGYQVQIATDVGFVHGVWQTTSKGPRVRAGALAEGNYYWRVRGANERAWSHTARFSVKAEAVPQVAPPPKSKLGAPIVPKSFEIQLPRNERRDSPWKWLKSLVESTAYADESVKILRWGAVEGARGYLVELAHDEAFTQRVISERVATAEWQMHDLDAGVYYLRIAGIGSDDENGVFSEPSRVVLSRAAPVEAKKPKPLAAPELLAPVDGEHVTLTGLLPLVSFSWCHYLRYRGRSRLRIQRTRLREEDARLGRWRRA